jgi:predicted outer membrane repeat protein
MFRPLLISLCLTSTALADTWTVDDDGKADFDNIQAAVDAASDGDEIIVMPGTYTGTGDEVVDMRGKEIWLHSSEGQEVTIIDGEGVRRGFLCEYPNWATYNTIIEGFTITNGYTNVDGGGMYIDGTFDMPGPENCTFTANSANNSGEMRNYGYSGPTLMDCTFIGNTAEGWASGGGMCILESSATLTDCTFTGNTAPNGGGMRNYGNNLGSDTVLINCVFTGNTSTAESGVGGGMYTIASNSTLTNCTFTGNTASNGGGIYSTWSNTTLTDTTVCDNQVGQIYGEWNDYGGNTVANVCSLKGTCCTNDICLDSEEEVDCIHFGGEWLGAGTTCEDNPCPTSCPGDINGDGQVNVNDLVILIAYWGACP